MIYNFDKIEAKTRYKLMSGSIIPRPIAWIVTEYDDVVNVAPFSYFTGLSSNPATILVSIGHKKDGSKKDTLANILSTKKAVVCIVDDSFYKKVDITKEELPHNESEADRFDIELERVFDNYPPMIKKAKVALFCDFFRTVDIGGKTIPTILEIKKMYIEDEIIDKEEIKIDFNSLARIGASYAKIGENLKI
jgi:flavin reductase (DIM6/NTAB) family NADH-FMN oxidoreductase RutF